MHPAPADRLDPRLRRRLAEAAAKLEANRFNAAWRLAARLERDLPRAHKWRAASVAARALCGSQQLGAARAALRRVRHDRKTVIAFCRRHEIELAR